MCLSHKDAEVVVFVMVFVHGTHTVKTRMMERMERRMSPRQMQSIKYG
jgi:hypothetical protein